LDNFLINNGTGLFLDNLFIICTGLFLDICTGLF
jgi:hypothetical protein